MVTQMGNGHVGRMAFCLKHNRPFLFKIPIYLTHASSERRCVPHINWTLTPHFWPSSHNPAPSSTFWFPLLCIIISYLKLQCNVVLLVFWHKPAFSEDYSHLWGKFMCLCSSALFVITVFNHISLFVLRSPLCPIVPTSVSAVWLQYLISPDFLNDPEDISLANNNSKTRLPFIIPLKNNTKCHKTGFIPFHQHI